MSLNTPLVLIPRLAAQTIGIPIMNIGLLGAGNIGKTLSRKLSAAGHKVKIANSRGPHTIEAEALEFGVGCPL